jgi:hypothetical protein
MLPDKEKQIFTRLKNDFEHYAQKCLTIRTKEGKLEPFTLNKAQRYVHAKVQEQIEKTGKVRAIVLKGRQQGMSTYIEGRYYWKVTHNFGKRAFILTHDASATSNLFEMAKRYYENCHDYVKPSLKTSNANELLFDKLDSGYKIGTAGNQSVGRSSTIQYLHASEVAFYQHADEHAKGIMQAVPDVSGTEVFIESTANGVGNWFHRQWQLAESGQSEYIALFVPWFWQDEYTTEVPEDFKKTEEESELARAYNLTDGQLVWRRKKIIEFSSTGRDGESSFKQEYPCNPNEAFQAAVDNVFINSELVVKARTANHVSTPEAVGPLLIGCDVARFGDDRTVIIRRKGRVAYGMEVFSKVDTMFTANRLHAIIEAEQPVRVFVDVVGLGAGVVDRLKELGHGKIVVAVNSANKAIREDLYANKRAEMWANGKMWLMDEPCCIPDSDQIHSDLCSPFYDTDSKGRIVIESKDKMKKRSVRSSDCADALLLTLSQPVSAIEHAANNTRDQSLQKLANSLSLKRQAKMQM